MSFVNMGGVLPLVKCPYMTARCPHYKAECDNPVSKGCHYVKSTTATLFASALYLRTLDSAKLSMAEHKYLQEIEAFLKESPRGAEPIL